MAITNRYGGEEVTHTLLAESRAEAQRWMEAFWQHFYDMSERGGGAAGPPSQQDPSPMGPLSLWDPHPGGTPVLAVLTPPCPQASGSSAATS